MVSPDFQSTKKRLQEAIGAGEVLKIIYQGGSQPGTLREVSPIHIKGGKVRARCFSSNSIKLFEIDKVIIVENEIHTKVAHWQPITKHLPHYESIGTLLEENRVSLTALGWHIENNSNCLSLHRFYKNDKYFKASDVSISYEEHTDDFGFSIVIEVDVENDLLEENKKKNKRPWIVRGINMSTKTYGSLDKAAEVFLERANLLAQFKLQKN